MKRILTICLMALLLLSSLSACGKKTPTTDETAKLGLGAVIEQSGSDAGDDSDGKAESDVTVAAVILGSDGKIRSCRIDVMQNRIAFDATGSFPETTAEVSSKKDLGDGYGMKDASEIGREWYEQAAAFEAYVAGKTAAEVAGIAVNEDGYATDSALTSGCTIKIGDFKAALAKACANAVSGEGAVCGMSDKLGLSILTAYESSKDADGETNGTAEADTAFTAVTTDGDGRVTACLTDIAQIKRSVTSSGTFTESEAGETKTKRELGSAYGMKEASDIGLEWFEQAKNFCLYAVGKTATEIAGIAVDSDGYPTDTALLSGCTIKIGDFRTTAAAAAKKAD